MPIKDLGVTISRDLLWSKHVGITVNKANEVLGIMSLESISSERYTHYRKSEKKSVKNCPALG